MSVHGCLRQATALVAERLTPGGIGPRPSLAAALAVPCQPAPSPRRPPLCRAAWRGQPLRLAFRPRHALPCVLGFLVAATVSSLGRSEPAASLTDGLFGATSTGSTTITVNIPHRIRVMGFRDITLGTYNGGQLTGSSPACVIRNGEGSYTVTMTSANGSFAMTSTTQAATIPYTVAWADRNISYNKSSIAFAPDNTASASCTPVPDRLRVTVSPEHMDVALPGAYVDTLRVMVTPL